MSGIERKNQVGSPDQKPSIPATWEEVCRREDFFKDKRLAEFPEKFLHFYKSQVENTDPTMRNFMDEVLQSARENYSESDAENIVKMYVFSCVLTQNNERRGKHGESQQFRKSEYDKNGQPLPAYIHPTRMLARALKESPSEDLTAAAIWDETSTKKKGVNAITAMAIAGHDLIEDCEMKVQYVDDNGKQTEALITGRDMGKTIQISDVIKSEFPEIGTRVATQIDAVTKYESFGEDFKKAMNESGLKLYLHTKLLPRRGTSNLKIEVKDQAVLDIEKAIASIYKIRAVPHQQYQDELKTISPTDPDFESKKDKLLDEYYQSIISGIYIKCLDTLDNGKGLSKASQIRARQLATLARLVGFYEISNDLMIMLAQKQDNPFVQDTALADLAKKLTTEKRQDYNQRIHNCFISNLGVPSKVETGLRISFPDENTESSTDAAVPQAIITVPTNGVQLILETLQTVINSDDFKTLVGENSELSYKVYGGILEKATRIWGRDGVMVRIIGKDKKTVFYLRFVDDKPLLSDYIMQDRPASEEKSPEESIFRRTPKPNESVNVPEKSLHAALFYLYPNYLGDKEYKQWRSKNLYIVVWDTGFTTIDGLQTPTQINESLGLGYNNPVISKFSEENGDIIEFDKQGRPKEYPELPIIRLKERKFH